LPSGRFGANRPGSWRPRSPPTSSRVSRRARPAADMLCAAGRPLRVHAIVTLPARLARPQLRPITAPTQPHAPANVIPVDPGAAGGHVKDLILKIDDRDTKGRARRKHRNELLSFFASARRDDGHTRGRCHPRITLGRSSSPGARSSEDSSRITESRRQEQWDSTHPRRACLPIACVKVALMLNCSTFQITQAPERQFRFRGRGVQAVIWFFWGRG